MSLCMGGEAAAPIVLPAERAHHALMTQKLRIKLPRLELSAIPTRLNALLRRPKALFAVHNGTRVHCRALCIVKGDCSRASAVRKGSSFGNPSSSTSNTKHRPCISSAGRLVTASPLHSPGIAKQGNRRFSQSLLQQFVRPSSSVFLTCQNDTTLWYPRHKRSLSSRCRVGGRLSLADLVPGQIVLRIDGR